MTSYATVEDYELRYGVLSDEDKEKVTTRLLDATAIIKTNGGIDNPKDEEKYAYKAVCCSMVHRVVISPSWSAMGVTQHSQTAGPFTESYSFGNPNGDLYLTSSERKTLKLKGMKIGTIAPMTRGDRRGR